MNPIDNLQTFLKEMHPYLGEPIQQENGALFYPITKEVLFDHKAIYKAIREIAKPEITRLDLEKYVKFNVFPTGFEVDLIAYHKAKLTLAFTKVPTVEVSEAIRFLSEKAGYTEEMFLREFGCAKITLYRYRTGRIQQRQPKAASEVPVPN